MRWRIDVISEPLKTKIVRESAVAQTGQCFFHSDDGGGGDVGGVGSFNCFVGIVSLGTKTNTA